MYSCNNITTTLIQISRLFLFWLYLQNYPSDDDLINSMWYKAQKVQKYALNSQLQALHILKNNDEVEN